MIFVLVGAMAFALEPSGAKGTTKTQQKPSSNASATKATSEELAAIKHVCEGLRLIKSKLQQVKGRLSEIKKMNNELKQVTMTIKKESLTPYSEKKVIDKKIAGSESEKSGGLIPAEKTRGQTKVTQQMKKMDGDAKRIKDKLVLHKNGIEREWKMIEGELRKVSGRSQISSKDRQCISKEVKELESQVASLQSQTDSLKSQMDDLKSQLDQQYGQGQCTDRIGQYCSTAQCEDCCAWQFKITEPEGTPARRMQQTERNNCITNCMAVAAYCNAKSLFGLAIDLIKSNAQRQTENVDQLTRI
jgi:chaperonin cofactor prefoldin